MEMGDWVAVVSPLLSRRLEHQDFALLRQFVEVAVDGSFADFRKARTNHCEDFIRCRMCDNLAQFINDHFALDCDIISHGSAPYIGVHNLRYTVVRKNQVTLI